MKGLFVAAIAALALAGCKDEGAAFVGEWKGDDARMVETITVTEASDGYRVISHLDKDEQGYMDVEVVLVAESDKLLVRKGDGRRGLEISENGTLKSHLRNGKDKVFTKVN